MLRLYIMAAFMVICSAGLSLTGCSSPIVSKTGAPVFDPLVHDWPHTLSDIPPDADITYGQLENGLRYALRRNARPEKEAVIRFWVRAGSRNETPTTIGLAHYLEHMAFNGSENVPEGEMVKSLERLGLSFGADTNASTTYWRTEYRLNLPNVDTETLDYGFFIMRETADKLLIEDAAVARERGVIKAEEASGNTPGRKASRAYSNWVYPERRSTQFNVIGSPETLDSMTAEHLRAFYKTHYRPDRSLIVMVGDLPVSEMEARIKASFGDWQTGTQAPPDPDDGKNSRPELDAKVYADDELTAQVFLSDFSTSTYSADRQSTRREHFIRGYANAIVNQRLNKKSFSKDAPFLGANISYQVGKLNNTASASVSIKDDDWQAALTLIENEIRQALEFGFQQAEYDELIAQSRRRYTDAVNYAAKRHTNSLAKNIVSAFEGAHVTTSPEQALKRFENAASTISLEALEAAFKSMWADFKPFIWLEGPQVGTVTPDDISAAYASAQTRALSPPATREKLDFAYQNFGTPGKIVWRGRVEDFDIDQVRFENNVRLNMKTTDFEDNWIRIDVTIGEGWNVFPKDKPGLTGLAGSIALGGYEAHKASELSQIFAGKTIGLNLNIGTERLRFSGATNPEDVEDQFNIWAGLLTAPGYRKVWQQKFQENIEASFHTIDATPGGVAARDLGRIWANGDRRYGMVTKAEYLSYTLEDVRKVLQPLFDKGAIEIGVVGDFDKDKLIDIVGKTFGALPARRADFIENPAAFDITFPASGRVELTHTGAKNQGAIYMGWPTRADWSLERSRHYTILRRIMQNRLIDEVRENQGLSYSPSAGLSFQRLNTPFGYSSVSISADPKFFDAFEKTAKTLAAKIRAGGITQDELNRARKPVIESFERSAKENAAWQGLVLRSQTDPRGLEYRRSRLKAYSDMTTQDLDTYAKELFAPKSLHIVVITPENLK